MPLPLGHSLMGYTLYETNRREKLRGSWWMLLLFVFVANLPDLDFVPGFLQGNANKYHHHYLSHSLGAALAAGLLIASIFYFWKKKHAGSESPPRSQTPVLEGVQRGGFLFYFLLFSGVCFSHVVLDYFALDTSEPYGVPMFWPLSSEYFTFPKPIFMSVHKVGRSDIFFQNLFVMHNLWVVLWEITVFIPVLVLVKLIQKRKILFAK